MLQRTRYFLFGAVVTAPVSALLGMVVYRVMITTCSDELYEKLQRDWEADRAYNK